jgi:hypothetical protein
MKPLRHTYKHDPKLYTMNAQEQSLHAALIDLCNQLADEILPKGSFLSLQTLFPTSLMDCILELAHDQKICTIKSLCDHISWAFLNSYGLKIFNLIQQFCPPLSSSPFTTAPLQCQTNGITATVASGSGSAKCTKPNKCSVCSVEGHNSAL